MFIFLIEKKAKMKRKLITFLKNTAKIIINNIEKQKGIIIKLNKPNEYNLCFAI